MDNKRGTDGYWIVSIQSLPHCIGTNAVCNNKAYKWNSIVAVLDPTEMIVKAEKNAPHICMNVEFWNYICIYLFRIAVRSTEFAQKKKLQKKYIIIYETNVI